MMSNHERGTDYSSSCPKPLYLESAVEGIWWRQLEESYEWSVKMVVWHHISITCPVQLTTWAAFLWRGMTGKGRPWRVEARLLATTAWIPAHLSIFHFSSSAELIYVMRPQEKGEGEEEDTTQGCLHLCALHVRPSDRGNEKRRVHLHVLSLLLRFRF
jgi:hypothetical protein